MPCICDETDSFPEPSEFIYQHHYNGYIELNGNRKKGKTNENARTLLSFELLVVLCVSFSWLASKGEVANLQTNLFCLELWIATRDQPI